MITLVFLSDYIVYKIKYSCFINLNDKLRRNIFRMLYERKYQIFISIRNSEKKLNWSGVLNKRSRWALAAPIIVNRRQGEVGCEVPYSAAFSPPVNKRYPLRLYGRGAQTVYHRQCVVARCATTWSTCEY